MYNFFKKVITCICLLGSSSTVYPDHLFQKYPLNFMERSYLTPSEPYIILDNIKYDDSDLNLTNEHNDDADADDDDDFVICESFRRARYTTDKEITKESHSFINYKGGVEDEDDDENGDDDDDEDDDDNDKKMIYIPSSVQRIGSLISKTMNYRSYLYSIRRYKHIYKKLTSKQEEKFVITPSARQVASLQEYNLTNYSIKKHLEKYPFEASFLQNLAHDQESLKEYLSWK